MLSNEFPDRLVTLADGRPGLRNTLQIEISVPPQVGRDTPCAQSPVPGSAGVPPASSSGVPPNTSSIENQNSKIQNPPAPLLDFIASDETLDRYDEIIAAGGWQLANYRRNPVFQNAHQYGDVIFTLGKALVTEVRTVAGRPALCQRIEFATDVNPMARIAYGLYQGKFLNAVSVGFIPLRWENGEGAKPSFRRKYLEQELIEVSAVGIPANPNALEMGLKAGAIAKADLRELLELLGRAGAAGTASEFGGPQAGPNTHAGASGVRSYEAQWLQLARDIKALMRRA